VTILLLGPRRRILPLSSLPHSHGHEKHGFGGCAAAANGRSIYLPQGSAAASYVLYWGYRTSSGCESGVL